MKRTPVLVLVAVLSAFAGYFMRATAVPDPDAAKYRAVRHKLEMIGQIDIDEYLRLRDQKSRYEKADEILGKILQLMIYDMGIRQSAGQLARIRDQNHDAPAPAPESAPHSQESHAPPEAPPTPGRPIRAAADWKTNGEKAKEVYRRDQVEDFLKSVEIPDFFNALKTGTPIGDAQLEMINGHFGGTVVFEDPREPSWGVSIVMDARNDGGVIVGTFDVRLSKNGKQFSRTKNTKKKDAKPKPIKSDNFMALDGDPNALVINAYGDDGYFQMYHFPRINEFHGLVYLKKSLGVFERKGVVHLSRR